MTLEKRKRAFIELGRFLGLFSVKNPDISSLKPQTKALYSSLAEKIELAVHHNGWFTKENILFAFDRWRDALQEKELNEWISAYDLPKNTHPKIVGIVMAGNIPLVGFHDFLSVLLSGHKVLVKLSSNDKLLLPLLADFLILENPEFANKIQFTEERLKEFDAVIATGSNNTARYFEYYFAGKPHIIRKNRNSAAVISGNETNEQLKLLGEDIFRYFGLGCRNVSKLYVPKNYNFDALFSAIFPWKTLLDHSKYANNYDYNKAVYLMSDFKLLDNGFLLLKEDNGFASPIATLFFQTYENNEALRQELKNNGHQLQCIVSGGTIENSVKFGETQRPKLWDYADGTDTLEFLRKLS